MKLFKDEAWQRIIRDLSARYSTGGREALGAMAPVEVYALFSDKSAGLRQASKQVLAGLEDELAVVRMRKLQIEVDDIAEWMKDHARMHENGHGMER